MSDSLRPVDCNASGSSVLGILQARILEWVAISFSRGSSRPRDRTQVSHIAGRCFNLWATKGTNTIREVPTSRNNHLPKASLPTAITLGLWGWLSSKEFTCKCRRCRFDPWVGKVPWRRKWQPTPIFLSGKCHVQKIPLAYSPWGCKGPDTT